MDAAPRYELRAGDRTFGLGERPVLMGILNTTPDSFSDGGAWSSLPEQVVRARDLVAQGAEILDVGGESGVTGRPAVAPAVEIDRVCPLIERVVGELDIPVSVDTYKREVAQAAIAAGAVMVNDTSGLRDPELARLCSSTGAALVVMHTRVEPKRKLADPVYVDVMADVLGFLGERTSLARELGVAANRLVVDPGPDFAKSPAQTVEVLRRLGELHALGYPVLLAASRKDFIGALTQRRPSARLAGSLAAVAHGVGAGAHILRVHDVAAVSDFLTVRAALLGVETPPAGLALPDELRWEQCSGKEKASDLSEACLSEAILPARRTPRSSAGGFVS